jgi:putative transposase
MPRKLVSIRENTTYHVWTRCLKQSPLMGNEYFRALLLEVINQTQKKYSFELNQFEIVDNHIHLIIYTLPGQATISRIMQYIKSRFAEKYNKITGNIGPVWNERYKYSIIEDSKDPRRYLLWLLWYLAFNSVRKKFVTDPRNYFFGGIKSYLSRNHKPPVKVTLHKFFLELADNYKDRLKVLLAYEDAYRKRLSWVMDWSVP